MQTVTQTIIGAFIVLAIAVLAYLGVATYVKNQAIDGCLKTATIEEKNGGKTITTPETYWFTLCMKEKGYK